MKNVIVSTALNKISFFCVGKVWKVTTLVRYYFPPARKSSEFTDPWVLINNKALIWTIKSHHGPPIQQDA